MIDPLVVRVFSVARVLIDRSWNRSDVRDPYWRLYLNDHEGAFVAYGRSRMALRPGSICVIPRDVAFGYRARGEILHFYVHFDLHGIPAAVVQEYFSRPFRLDGPAGLVAGLNALAATVPWTSGDAIVQGCLLQGLVCEAIGAHLEKLPRERLTAAWSKAANAAVLPALDHIDEHFPERITNRQLAALCHMSVDHFIRRFRNAVGSPPNRYVTDRRVAAAAQLLRFSSTPIDEIAQRTGFGNAAYMTRIFGRRMGMPPGRYRTLPV